MIMLEDLEKKLTGIINDLNSISKNIWGGSIRQDDNDSYYFLLDSRTVHGIVELDLSLGKIEPTFNFYHKNLQISSLGETNLFKGYTDIASGVKQAIKDLQKELKNL